MAPDFAQLALVLECANAFDSEPGLNFMREKIWKRRLSHVLGMGSASAPVMTFEPQVSQSQSNEIAGFQDYMVVMV
jgi:hypothetical protein